MANVLVTLEAAPQVRSAIEEELEGVASVIYLVDVPESERLNALSSSDAVLAGAVADELRTAEEYSALASAKLLQVLSAGVNNLPFDRLPDQLTIASNAGAWSLPMAEHVIGMVLALAKRLPQRHEALRRGVFDQSPNLEVRGATVAILGFGGIGQAVANLLRPFGARIHAVSRSGKTDQPVDAISTLDELSTVLAEADIIVISLPLNRVTTGLIGARELALMKSDAILVNVARAAIIDEDALYEHLASHPAFSAGIDVWWDEPRSSAQFSPRHPFVDLANVVGSPHNSGTTANSATCAAHQAAANIARAIRGEKVSNVVDRGDYAH